MSNYSFNRRTQRWTVSSHYYFLNMFITNAYKLYTLHCAEEQASPMTHKAFRESLASDLMAYTQTQPTAAEQSRISRNNKLSVPLNSQLHNWTPYLLNRDDRVPLETRKPIVHQPFYLATDHMHRLEEIQDPRRGQRDERGKLIWKWRPKCIAKGCGTTVSKACVICHAPLCDKCFTSFHCNWELSNYLLDPK
eukprot:NODE_553_length_6120_cov_0.628135.p3 type:complete len:193 gc:universal NODE_553_length_6120_cov_0.628135:2781-2203(-)